MPLQATCHCGATRITLPSIPDTAKSCNCSFCQRTGAVWAYYAPAELEFHSLDGDRSYSASGMNQHHFCGTCGIHTWGDSPDWASVYNADGTAKNDAPGGVPSERIFAINLNTVDGLDWSKVQIETIDGRKDW